MKKLIFIILVFILILPFVISDDNNTVFEDKTIFNTQLHLNGTFIGGAKLKFIDYSETTVGLNTGNGEFVGFGLTEIEEPERFMFAVSFSNDIGLSDNIDICSNPCGLSENNCDDIGDYDSLCSDAGCGELAGANITAIMENDFLEILVNGVSLGGSSTNFCNDSIYSFNNLQTFPISPSSYAVLYRLVNGSVNENITCPFPSLLCEQFIYSNPFANHGWDIFQPVSGLNITALPSDNGDMFLQDLYFLEIEIPAKSGCYRQSEEIQICETRDYPMVTVFWDLEINNSNTDNTQSELRIIDDVGIIGMKLLYNQNNISYVTNIFTNEQQVLCQNCLNGTEHFYTMNIMFKENVSSYFTTVFGNQSTFNLFQGNNQIATDLPITDNRFKNVRRVSFANSPNQNFTLDNLFVVAGNSKVVDNVNSFIIPNFVFPDETDIILNNATISMDTVDRLKKFFDNFGFSSTASKVLLSLIVMIAVGVGMTFVKIDPTIILLTSVGVLGFFSFIGFMPSWIMIVVLLIGIGFVITLYRNVIGGGG